LTIARTVAPGSTVYADEATHWDALHARFLTKRINHSEAYSDGDAGTNQAESFFSRLRRAEIRIHHHVAGPYLAAYAREMAWRENNRRINNGEQYLMAAYAACSILLQDCGVQAFEVQDHLTQRLMGVFDIARQLGPSPHQTAYHQLAHTPSREINFTGV
jgi:hypothetical protein